MISLGGWDVFSSVSTQAAYQCASLCVTNLCSELIFHKLLLLSVRPCCGLPLREEQGGYKTK